MNREVWLLIEKTDLDNAKYAKSFSMLKQSTFKFGGVAEWLRVVFPNHARSTRPGSNPILGTTSHKPTVNSAVHLSEVGK